MMKEATETIERDPELAVQHVSNTEPKRRDDFQRTAEDGNVQRGLKSRHIQLIAIGGTVGTGLFIGSGGVLAETGPAPLLMSYIIMSAVVWILTMDLAEVASYMPIRGMTIPYLVQRFVDPSLAFAFGWNYWFAYSMIPPAEATASAVIMEYWTTAVPPAAWITIIIVVCVLLNLVAVKYYGEVEFWFASIKIVAILALLLIGLVIFFGGAPTHDRIGFRYWSHPGAFKPYLLSGSAGRFLAVWDALIRAGFSYILSPELIATAAGECQAPRRNIPKAARRYIWRLLLFYVGGALVIGAIVPHNDVRLLGASNASASPFVIGIHNAAIPVLDHVLNAVALTAAWSAGNAQLYSASRMLYGMACNGKAPKIFRRCNRWGVPHLAVLASSVLSLLGYLNLSSKGADVFVWLTTIITVSGMINWNIILVTYLRFRAAVRLNGIEDRLPFKSPFQPYSTYCTLFMLSLMCITNGFAVFFPHQFNIAKFVTSYASFPIFIGLYIAHRWQNGRNKPWIMPVTELNVFSGLEEVEEITAKDVPPVPRNIFERIWFWIC
ncbi:proline-specific permease [Cordyceps fumosorosea ARSEF 2679]|uniref:Proline-specific permease n=1 Tax=Cordyceps fumosorosea (strain ARSEF 2679) TaxID=1081104 RepID=A0A167VYQ4_CORFA|nr:proline-specific permease [Cordyceps fumosorosea ARSEF 2679]OAA63128.1 proline-specific permease [Cordyceps fumosorosea ARSEF 2679]